MPIPDGLTLISPGAELAGLLARVNVERVSGFDTVEVLKAAYRQICHDRAWFLRALLEVGLRDSFSGDEVARLEVPDEFGPDEARAALVWSRRRADSTFELAWNVHRRLPILGEAMLAGTLDEPRAVAFVRWTVGLTDEQAALVCEQLVPQAPSWTVGELIERIQRLALAIDPAWAERRYAEAVRRRRVVGTRNEDGTATVSGLDLPLDRAAAGCDRIDELARACKRAGDRRPIDHIRVDLFLGSLDGTFEGMSDEEIIAHILCHPFHDTTDPLGSPEDDAGNTLDGDDNPDGDVDPGGGNAPDGDDDSGGGNAPDGDDNPDGGGDPGGGNTRNGDDNPGDDDTHGGDDNFDSDDTPGGDDDPDRPGRAGSVSPGTDLDRFCGGGGMHPDGDLDERDGGRIGGAADFTDGYGDAAEGDRDVDTCRRPGNDSGGSSPESGSHSTNPHPAGSEEPAPGAPAPDDEPERGGAGSDKAGPDEVAPCEAVPCEAGADRGGLRHVQARAEADTGVWAGAGGWPVREIRVELTTLLGLDEHAAHLPAWGVIHPCLARRIVAGMLGGQWRYAICHDDGHLALTGLTRARPHAPGQRRPTRDRRRGGIVELQITVSRLRVLAAQPVGVLGAWAPVVADLSAHATPLLTFGEGAAAPDGTARLGDPALNGNGPGGPAQDRGEAEARHEDRYQGWHEDGTTNGAVDGAVGGAVGGRAEGLQDGASGSERRRQAGAALRRYVQIRGRVCSWPGCRTPATRADQDHILPWAEQGPTKAENLHLACRHDHRARHHGGWSVSTADPHLVIWTSPLGHRYPSPLPKIIVSACDPHPRSRRTPSPYRYVGDLSDTPTMSPMPEPPLSQEAPQPDSEVAAPWEPDGEAGAHGSLLGGELDEPPF
ncbi:HNH endonuclease signature motif containing protein [Microbispora bryophytorum]|uniref:HNH endonuclease signature motif containing protein n=1 Tax=Microbispora bryophytorum TaxID=1460882 RepID=UPI00340870E9